MIDEVVSCFDNGNVAKEFYEVVIDSPVGSTVGLIFGCKIGSSVGSNVGKFVGLYVGYDVVGEWSWKLVYL